MEETKSLGSLASHLALASERRYFRREMPTRVTRTWAKRATLLGLVLIVGSFLAAVIVLQDAFRVMASYDPANKAQLLADAMMKAERIKGLTRFTSKLGTVLFIGGLGMLAFLRLRKSPPAVASSNEDGNDDSADHIDDDLDEEDEA